MASSRGSEVVRRYAATVLDAAAAAGVTDAVRRDLAGLASTLRASTELTAFLGNRLIDPAATAAALARVFAGRVDNLTLNFLRLVAQRRRADLLPQIAVAALQILDARSGTDTAEVRSATPLTAPQLEALRQGLARYTGRQVQIHAEVDASLRGGLVARVGDMVFDGSVETQLRRLRERLARA